METPPPLPVPDKGPRLLVFGSLAAGGCAMGLIWYDWATSDPYLLPAEPGLSLFARFILLCVLTGLGTVCYCFISRRLFGFPALYVWALAALLLNIAAGLLWLFPASLLPARPHLHRAVGTPANERKPDLDDFLQAIKRNETDGPGGLILNSTGERQLVAEAHAAYLLRLQQVEASQTLALNALMAAHVLRPDFNGNHDRITKNRMIVRQFVDATRSYSNFLAHAESNYREEFQQRGASPKLIEQAGLVFDRRKAGILLEQAKLGTHTRIGTAQLALLDLMEHELGKWKKDRETGLVLFADEGAAQKYKELQAEIDDAVMLQFEIIRKISSLNGR